MVKIDLFWRKELTGTLSSRFSELPDLQFLHLGRPEVSDAMLALHNNLWELRYASRQVSGDLSALKNLTKLEFLFLQGTEVSGNIAALENLRELTQLNLGETKVFGDLAALENLTKLENLKLDSTQLSGNIGALQNLTKLDFLDLSDTQVIGDMSFFEIHVVEG